MKHPVASVGSSVDHIGEPFFIRADVFMIAISDNVQVRKDPPSGTVILNRPDKHNAISREMVDMLQQAFEDLHQERTVRAVILTGTGTTFCSGTDLVQLRETMDSTDAIKVWHDDAMAMRRLIETMLRYPKPIIAAINGPVVGIGLALMLACDLVIADRDASLVLPEAKRGLVPGLTTPLLAFRVGTAHSSRMLFTGENVSSDTAISTGLFHEAVTSDLVWARSQQAAQNLAVGARESWQLTKKMLNETVGEMLFVQLSIAAANMASARTTDAAKEGVQAFLEKRDPDWGI